MTKIFVSIIAMLVATPVLAENMTLIGMNGQCTDPEFVEDYAYYGAEDGSVEYLGYKVDFVDNYDNESGSSFFREGKAVFEIKFNTQEGTACVYRVKPGTKLTGLTR